MDKETEKLPIERCGHQKEKILRIMDALLHNTDEQHPMNAQQLISMLKQYGIRAERKSIYADVETLQHFGIDVNKTGQVNRGYYVGSREFELAELKLLVDAVQCSKFITKKKSEDLIKKLEHLTNKYAAKELRRQVYVTGRVKTSNERIFYSIDQIHMAIHDNCKVKFQYASWNLKKELVPRKNGEYYVVSPIALVWDDENYYLVAYDAAAELVKHYRVDKILNLQLLENESREGEAYIREFNSAEYAKSTFGMFRGEEKDITLKCKKELVGSMIDRFGTDIMILGTHDTKCEEVHFHTNIAISDRFFGWLAGFSGQVTIEKPAEVVCQYKEWLHQVLKGL